MSLTMTYYVTSPHSHHHSLFFSTKPNKQTFTTRNVHSAMHYLSQSPFSPSMAESNNAWEEMLRKMLPEGAPLPDEDELDYSISVDYTGPSPFTTPPPIINIISPKSKFTAYPKHPPSLTPNRCKSSSNSDHNKRFRAISVASDYEISEADETEEDRCDRDDFSCSDDGEKNENVKMKCRVCSRCREVSGGFLKGRFRCRCVVCGAGYCRKCVLKAMGPMQERRKCVGCVGKPIEEASRGRVGKGSRWLAKACGRLEVKRITERERECEANKMVRAEQVIVNKRLIREEELDQLLGHVSNLRPGRYWYDRNSGLWGKEGQKPNRIISSKLDVGGELQVDASNGSTRVYMNGREITKVELKVLKLAKVQCPRNTHFWLYEDGSYEEEGQNNIKGYIWKKASVRFFCSLFSLPVPPETANCTKEEQASSSATSFSEYIEQEQHRVQKLLLVGLQGSGTSTIFKQVKLIYTNKFTAEELQNIKFVIQSNTYRYLSILLEGREHFEEEALQNKEHPAADRFTPGETECDGSRHCVYSVNEKIKNFSDWLLDLVSNGDIETYFPAAACEYAPVIDEIWKDPAIQETYKRREELLFLPEVAKYFFDRVIEISSIEYEPSEKDILFADFTLSNGLACIDFSFDDQSAISEIYKENTESQLPLSNYHLIQFSSKGLNFSRKWLDMFEGMSAIVFCISLCDYDQLWTDSTGFQQNKMVANRDFFKSVARNSCFEGTSFVLLLNKYDLFEDKIDEVPVTVCEWFRDFNPLMTQSKNISSAHKAYYYIAMKFKELYTSVTGRKLYVRQVRALEQTSVDEAFRYIREILEWEELMEEGIYARSEEDSFSSAESV